MELSGVRKQLLWTQQHFAGDAEQPYSFATEISGASSFFMPTTW